MAWLGAVVPLDWNDRESIGLGEALLGHRRAPRAPAPRPAPRAPRRAAGGRILAAAGSQRPARYSAAPTGSSSRIPALIAQAFLTAAAIAPSIQRRPRWSQASLANHTRPTGRTISS